MSANYAVLLAAGSGSRMGAGKNKIFLDISGKSMLRRSAEAIEKSAVFKKLIVVVKKEELEMAKEHLKGIGIPAQFVFGGLQRQDSVYNALLAIPEEDGTVAIHDAARCMASPSLFCRCVKSAEEHGSGVAGRRVNDTVKSVSDGRITGTLDRNGLVLIETPQVFRTGLIKQAYEKAYADGFYGTDDAMLLERTGISPVVIYTDGENIKLTRPEDMSYGEFICGGNSTLSVGQGFDAHRFCEGRPLVIGGVTIDYPLGLLGHSDADVLAHAIADAILGAAGHGDIGELFPDTDAAYKDIRSMILLEKISALLKSEDIEIENIDACVIMQRPKISAFKPEMKKNIAAALDMDESRVNIKATTTEGMGFTGAGEGAAAQAVCMVKRRFTKDCP